jgi:hypothetical protein
MGLLLEQIELIEGKKELTTIISTMRSLGKDVDEVRQYLEKSTGKRLDDISDDELAQIAAAGALAGIDQSMAPAADKDPDLQRDFKQAQTAMEIPYFGPKVVASRVRDMMPSGKYTTYSPDGKPIDIDVDISGSDLSAIKSAVERAGKTFPDALADLEKGKFSSALNKVISKTVAPSVASQPAAKAPTSKGNWNQSK